MQPDAALLEFLRIDELLVDIGKCNGSVDSTRLPLVQPWHGNWTPRDVQGTAAGGAGVTMPGCTAGRPSTHHAALHTAPNMLLAPPPSLPPSLPAGDDLLDYEDDICAGGGGSFNIFRCYVHLYGRDAPLHLARRIGQLEAERERLLAALPAEQQAHVRRRQVDAAGEEGAGALRWQMPPLVLDEAAFRTQYG